jgi:hypothetical protein
VHSLVLWPFVSGLKQQTLSIQGENDSKDDFHKVVRMTNILTLFHPQEMSFFISFDKMCLIRTIGLGPVGNN